MAVDSSSKVEQVDLHTDRVLKVKLKEHQIGNVPVDCSCLKELKAGVDDLNRQFPLEIPPIRVEETSHAAGLHGSHVQDIYSFSMLPEEGDNVDCASPLTFLSILEVPNQAKSPMCLDAHLNCQNCFDFQMKSEEEYSQCVIDIPSVIGIPNSPESYGEGVESFKTGNSPTSILWRESSLKGGAKVVQSLMSLNNSRAMSAVLDKPVNEKLHDLPSNRWRRYKRAASFDSRKVALLFSILSSFGTLVLIYLTLRVRQKADGFVFIS